MKSFYLTIFIALSLSVVAISGTDESNNLSNILTVIGSYGKSLFHSLNPHSIKF